jgi:hypothetical protein
VRKTIKFLKIDSRALEEKWALGVGRGLSKAIIRQAPSEAINFGSKIPRAVP